MAQIDQQGWFRDALCRQVPSNVTRAEWVDVFFPPHGETRGRAKGVCARCPVARECIEAAVVDDEKAGVWGGTSERKRRRWRRLYVAGRMDELHQAVKDHLEALRRVHAGSELDIAENSDGTIEGKTNCPSCGRRTSVYRDGEGGVFVYPHGPHRRRCEGSHEQVGQVAG